MNPLFSVILVLAACLAQALEFSQSPSIVKDTGTTWKIEFAVSESTDVEVSIVNTAGSSVVRHLAAGVLGANPPAPLVPNTLSQTIVWDGKDDYRRPVADMNSIDVRVRAGMSVKTDNMAGGDPYAGFAALHAMELNTDGTVLLGGATYSTTSNALRQFTAKGEYLKTLFPATGAQTAAASGYWGTVTYNNGQWSPKSCFFGTSTFQTTSPIRRAVSLIPMHDDGQVAVVSLGLRENGDVEDNSAPFTDWIMNDDGTRNALCESASKPIIASPLLAPPVNQYGGNWGGPLFFAMDKTRTHFFMSGFFRWDGAYTGNQDPTPALTAADTGFYIDGRLFKVDMATRTATVFFSLDTVVKSSMDRRTLFGNYNNAELHGVATDDSGRVYVCDRLHNKVWILDSTGTILGAVKAQAPDAVTVNSTTGAIYVTHYVNPVTYLSKYSDWRADSNATVNLAVYDGGLPYSFGVDHFNKTMLLTCETDEGTLVWVGGPFGVGNYASLRASVVIYKDNGASFSVYKDFRAVNTQPMVGVFRVAADARTDEVYLQAMSGRAYATADIYRVRDWNNPLMALCSTSVGAPIVGYELAVDPDRRYLYTRGNCNYDGITGPLYRYTLGDKLIPAPLPGCSTNAISASYSVRAAINDVADHGIAMAPNGNLAVIDCRPALGYQSFVRYFTDTSSTVVSLLDPININNSGVAFDLAGNLYVGMKPASADIALPAEVKSDVGFRYSVGSIYKYRPTGSLDSVNFYPVQPAVDKVYAVDYGDLGGGHMSNCTCVTARFSLDKFGRLYVPNVMLQKVTVVDNAGNWIVRIGNYGNADNIRDEIAGKTATGLCYMGYPKCVDATEDYIYVSDQANCALLRIKKEFALDNIPGLTTHTAATRPALVKNPLVLSVFPNPFTAQGRISVVLPSASKMTLEVIDLSGRVVKRVASGSFEAGAHSFAWKGAVASGIYILRLKTDKNILTRKIIIAR